MHLHKIFYALYEYEDGTTFATSTIQKITANRFVLQDESDPSLNKYYPWVLSGNADLKVKSVEGYTVDTNLIPGLSLPNDEITNYDNQDGKYDIHVIYKPKQQVMTIEFVDVTSGRSRLKQIRKDGFSGGEVDYNPAQDIQYYKDLGYTVVNNTIVSSGNKIKFTADPDDNQYYEVDLKDGTTNNGVPTDADNSEYNETHHTVTRTINYEGTPTSMDKVVQNVNFERTYTTDNVTKKTVKYGNWTLVGDSKFESVISPLVLGYSPETYTVQSVTPEITDTDSTETVIYTINGQTLDVIYHDDTDDKTIDVVTKQGSFNQTGTYEVTDPENYELAENQLSSVDYTFANNSDADNFTIHLVHKHETSVITTTRTINYNVIGSDINAPEPTVESVNWNVDTDKVTGEITYTPTDNYAEVKVNTIHGTQTDGSQYSLVPETKTVASVNLNTTQTKPESTSETVNYKVAIIGSGTALKTETSDPGYKVIDSDTPTQTVPTDEVEDAPVYSDLINQPETKSQTTVKLNTSKNNNDKVQSATQRLPQTGENNDQNVLVSLGLIGMMFSFMGITRFKKRSR
ncbi:mucin-binding protein [Paucilactobacillus nenjiangensis]|uniref:mucin-binding protein n=1 Tax=Paucilactobacillus nenjiangensis TaxID=1296540 RepID=UPI0010F7F635|nr:LPXTG cell wall anchor domain-containing protein [Paucilactobacillus nenjiangensis]